MLSPHPARILIRHRKLLVGFNRSFFSTRLWRKEVVEPTSKTPLQIDIEGPDEKTGELRLLNRPLGVRERPTTIVKTRKEKLNELLDSDKRMEQRRHLYVPC